jgi:hypothetical protein
MFSGLFLGLSALPCLGQEPPLADAPQKPIEKSGELPVPKPAGPPTCGFVETHKTTYQLHWLERKVPGCETTHKLREVITPSTKCGLALEWNYEVRSRTEMVLKPCEVTKEVTICTQKPIVKVDPCTGCSTVIFEPVKETKLVKEITYQLVCEEKQVTVRTPFLRPTEEPIGIKTLVLDSETKPVIRTERFGVLVPVEITERKPICAPPPPCPLPAPCKH